MEQWDAANPSIDRPILALCYLLGLADPGSYAIEDKRIRTSYEAS